MNYHFKVHKNGTGYWAECIELRGCATQGADRKGLKHNMKEALNAYLDEPDSSKTLFPLPRQVRSERNTVAVSVEPHVAFSFMLRRERLEKGLTQKTVAEKLRVSLYGYQRLESSKTANPRLSTIIKLQSIFPGLPLEKLVA
jgi:antitoxin HicB